MHHITSRTKELHQRRRRQIAEPLIAQLIQHSLDSGATLKQLAQASGRRVDELDRLAGQHPQSKPRRRLAS